MSERPRLLDLFACEGGAGAGYARGGWRTYGVDLDGNRAKRYPTQRHVGSVEDVLTRLLAGDLVQFWPHVGTGPGDLLGLGDFAAIHASPPCQWYTRGNAPRRGTATKWERTIPTIREALEATGKPYVIENVKDAAWDLRDPVTLCGCMFGLSTVDTDGVTIHLQRPRLFETNWSLEAPRACDHSAHEWVAGAYGGARRDKYEAKYVRRGGYVPPDKDVVKALLGVEHDMTWNGLFECLPPAYTEWIGANLLAAIEGRAAA